MFNAAANRKHSYLHKWLKSNEPGVTNVYMDQAMRLVDLEAPITPLLNGLASMQPHSYGLVLDQTKAQLAYGSWGVPQLIAQLVSKDRLIRFQALGTLIDEMIDPEKCRRAFGRLAIVRQLSRVLKDEIEINSIDMDMFQRILIVLQTIASHETGAEHILTDANLFKMLNYMVQAGICTCDVAKLWSNMASNAFVSDLMNEANYMKFLLFGLFLNPDNYDYYSALAYLAARSPQMSIAHGFFEFLSPKITQVTRCTPVIIKCFALTIQCDKGQEKCDQTHVIPRLLDILNHYEESDPEPTLDWRQETMTLEYAAMALHNCLISTRSRWMCQEYWDMPEILVRHAHCKTNDRLQVHCLQALRHITEKPSIKRYVGTVCKSRIKRIHCSTDRVRRAKVELLNWLRFRNYHCDQPTTADVLL